LTKSIIIVVEGLDGSGKSSLVNKVAQHLQEKYSSKGVEVVAWATPTALLTAIKLHAAIQIATNRKSTAFGRGDRPRFICVI
jgi:thymidylate kinase